MARVKNIITKKEEEEEKGKATINNNVIVLTCTRDSSSGLDQVEVFITFHTFENVGKMMHGQKEMVNKHTHTHTHPQRHRT